MGLQSTSKPLAGRFCGDPQPEPDMGDACTGFVGIRYNEGIPQYQETGMQTCLQLCTVLVLSISYFSKGTQLYPIFDHFSMNTTILICLMVSEACSVLCGCPASNVYLRDGEGHGMTFVTLYGTGGMRQLGSQRIITLPSARDAGLRRSAKWYKGCQSSCMPLRVT